MKRQPEATAAQLWLALAHMTAAVIASSIATTHALAVIYHCRRLSPDEPSGDSGELNDLTYREAIKRKQGV